MTETENHTSGTVGPLPRSAIVTIAAGAATFGLVGGIAIANDGGAATAEPETVEASAHSHDDADHDHVDTQAPSLDDDGDDHTTYWNDGLVERLVAYATTNDEVSITATDDAIVIAGSGVPDHDTGSFPNAGNPNTISAQDVDVTIPRTATYTGTPTDVAVLGITLGGVVFDPATAESDPETGWRIEAFNSGVFNAGEDFNNAHVQPDGTYHYHGVPTAVSDLGGDAHSNLIGFAADGFPVYSVYGYSDPDDAYSGVVAMESSWALKEGPRGAGKPDGDYNGDYTNDFEFVEGSGDLDECNGRFTVTPEFPDGTYAYFITEEFPYVSRCLMGEVDSTGLRTGGAGGAPAGGAPGGEPAARPEDGGHQPPSGTNGELPPPPPGGHGGPPPQG